MKKNREKAMEFRHWVCLGSHNEAWRSPIFDQGCLLSRMVGVGKNKMASEGTSTQPQARKVRGRTSLPDIVGLKEGQQITLERNEFGQPVTKKAATFANYCGMLARDGNLAPIDVKDWRNMPQENKEAMWEYLKALKLGEPPSRAKLFIMTHIRKDGQPVDEASEIAMAWMRERMSQCLEESVDPIAKDDIYASVIGPERRGLVRGLGFGVSPSNIFGKKSRLDPYAQENHEMDTLRQQYAELQQQHAELQQQHTELQQQHTELQQQHVVLGQLVDNVNLEIASLHELFRGYQ